MAETAGTQIIRVLPPGVKRTGPANEKIMRIGWRAVADGLLAPKSALRCDVLHVAGDPPRDALQLVPIPAAQRISAAAHPISPRSTFSSICAAPSSAQSGAISRAARFNSSTPFSIATGQPEA